MGALASSGSTPCLLPVGATEQHGPHLGTGVDSAVAEKVCHAVSAETGALVLPTLPYGCSLGHSRHWPGTLALTPQLVIELTSQIIDWAYGSGFRRFFLVNGHVTNFAPLRCALELVRARYDDALVAVCQLGELSPRIKAEFSSDAADWHANAAETSLMLAIAPELVRPDQVATADDEDRTNGLVFAHPVNHTSTNGVTGHPSRGSVKQGSLLFQWLVEDLSALVRQGMVEEPPVPKSFRKS